ncbi:MULTISPECIES: MerR family transcriptional regulator [Pseudoalteromonas]|uniref:Putative transcriptional regulator n=1 Tax=Pseudoalteromonas luteoviolacea (strain 2ta16) TaxID=1353533 RepID=V4HL49_PSEL2|nr:MULTISPECIES: MerR family transcriptional regulator [Pseudoalteromonas]ESP91550.1 putative transcriptional regulator [Pseudoalteromonas luteoviolacea 2ta16]KZN40197.1 hypothetical protein N483_18580 [Pseudoalteromonas luteoviolacea NCIMB 1944]MBQ4835682.1 MerR family transcriptional regulator [Pseudoalteromonas luteoviolacea]MCG7549278.1 MerR family transcriptional regulator [Pseudoalteromonas sp. Of7M-16]
MYIGEVANKTGLSIKAIRLYETRGLIKTPLRQGRYRVYEDSHIEVLNLIKEAKSLGSTLAQLDEVIVYQNGEVDWLRIEQFLVGLKCQLSRQVDSLNSRISRIENCLSTIKSCPSMLDSTPRGRD